jgi:hypothetical protein
LVAWRGFDSGVVPGEVGGEAEVFVNGRRLAPLPARWRNRSYRVPADAIVHGENNRILVKVTSRNLRRESDSGPRG